MTANIMMLALGLVIGGVAVWLIFRAKIQAAAAQANAEGQTERAVLSERLQAKDQEIGRLKGELDEAKGQAGRLNVEVSGLKAEQERLNTVVQKEREAAHEKLAVLNDARAKLTDEFKVLSADALKSNNQSLCLSR